MNILYVENAQTDWDKLARAVEAYNAAPHAQVLTIARATDPAELTEKLSHKVDVLLADLFFNDAKGRPDKVNKLDEILTLLEKWEVSEKLPRPIPVIVYTGKGKATLEFCLARKERLYDIWDKSMASPEYITWRLTRLAVELSRLRPDALMLRLVRGMVAGASWHSDVVTMAQGYDEGWTETDQVVRAGRSVKRILEKLGELDTYGGMWEVVENWEPLSRGASKQIRGHARHVINVFWLGYYLINHPSLRTQFKTYWEAIVANRSRMDSVKDVDPLEAINNAWFYAGLFHDVANCVERTKDVFDGQARLLAAFDPSLTSAAARRPTPAAAVFDAEKDSFFEEFVDPTLRRQLVNCWKEGATSDKPDHGLVAALHLRRSISEGPQSCIAREAARAIALHNRLPHVMLTDKHLQISWANEPLGCLLLLCDQIQTWDREREDATYQASWPDRAELAEFKIEGTASTVEVTIVIDYIAPPNLIHAPKELYAGVRDKLVDVLRTKPNLVVGRMTNIPFRLKANFALGGETLDTEILA